jgi:hypothetical protein
MFSASNQRYSKWRDAWADEGGLEETCARTGWSKRQRQTKKKNAEAWE